MSAVCVLVPVVIGGWPAISAAAAAAAAALGLNVAQEVHEVQKEMDASHRPRSRQVEVPLENSHVLEESMRAGEQIVLTRGSAIVRVGRDERGQCRVCVNGEGSLRELEALGEEVAGRIAQMFVYHRVMSELRSRGFEVAQEEVAEDRSLRIRVRGRL